MRGRLRRRAIRDPPEMDIYGIVSADPRKLTDARQIIARARRVFDAPIAEGGLIAIAIGMGAYGLRPVVERQFAD